MSKKADSFKRDIIFRAIQFGFKKKEEFLPDELFSELKIAERSVFYRVLESNFVYAFNIVKGYSNIPGVETIFVCISEGSSYNWKDYRYILTTEAKFKYIDFLELEQARENSEQAQKHARIAEGHAQTSIRIALWALIISGVGALVTVLEFIYQPTFVIPSEVEESLSLSSQERFLRSDSRRESSVEMTKEGG